MAARIVSTTVYASGALQTILQEDRGLSSIPTLAQACAWVKSAGDWPDSWHPETVRLAPLLKTQWEPTAPNKVRLWRVVGPDTETWWLDTLTQAKRYLKEDRALRATPPRPDGDPDWSDELPW